MSYYGLNIDPAPKNVASLRGYSWDEAPLFRHDAKPYYRYFKPTPKKPHKTSKTIVRNCNLNNTQARVEQAIQRLKQSRIDITTSEPTWFRIACAFANEFGEQGRGYFHEVSQFHSEYDAGKADRKFDHALRGQFRQIGIGTFLCLLNR